MSDKPAKLNVAATIRVLPDAVETDLDAITKKIAEITAPYGRVHSSEKKPIAFGLKSLDVVLLLADKKGGIDEITEKVKEMPGVSEVDVIDVNLV
ncbi:Elongation factor 1-beta [uncultured archaeon]|nr:Elongation factor 1-beta [uncultured archaeon]